MSALLEVRGLTLTRGSRTLVRGLDLVLCAGQGLAILGRNGAGKTTLLHALAGLHPADDGDITLDGQAYRQWPPREAARRRGLLTQHPPDAFGATVFDLALMGRHPHLSRWAQERPEDRRLARQALTEVGLHDLADRPADTLSGGERQRLTIATLLTQAPPLMLLDEPLAHLDLGAHLPMLELLTQRAAATVMVLHDPTLAARFCDHTLMLFGDGHWLLGASQDIIHPETLGRLHGHPFVELHSAGRRVFLPA